MLACHAGEEGSIPFGPANHLEGYTMTFLLGIILIICSVLVGIFISPILLMMGIMGASEGHWYQEIVGLGVCLFAIAAPISMVVYGTILLF